jgi:CO/xanthine dehydrogenase FAD-binding subunit
LADFLVRPPANEVLEKIIIPSDHEGAAAFQAMRNSVGDFALLNATVCRQPERWRIVVGARPTVARLAMSASKFLSNASTIGTAEIERAAELTAAELSFGASLKASAAYRRTICRVLVQRAMEEVMLCNSNSF